MDLIRSQRFTRHIEDLLQEHRVPGLVIAIIQNGESASAGFGHSCLDPAKPCTPDTLFDIGSSSKSLTAASVGLLVEDNDNHPEIQWDAPVSTVLPEDFILSDDRYTNEVTIEDILSHRSGVAPHENAYLSPRATHPDTPKSITRNLRNLPTAAAPVRTKYIYNNTLYTVATHLIETKTNLSFSDFLQTRFFDPLGMSSTALQPSRAHEKGLSDRIATGYFYDHDHQRHRSFEPVECPEGQGAGSIITSVNDYIKYVNAFMNHATPFSPLLYNSLLASRTLQDPQFKELRPFSSPVLYSLGWETYWYRGYMVVQHDGLVSGFASKHFFLPDFKFGGCIFGNATSAADVVAIVGRELIDEVLKVPEVGRVDWNDIEMGKNWDPDSTPEELEEEVQEVREELCPGIEKPEVLSTPLELYTGAYWNEGYRGLTVEVREGKLFVDASDRSMGFTLTFEHVCGQTKFVAHLSDWTEGGDGPCKAEFVLSGGKAVRMGIELEEEIEELILFDRVGE